ncbi:MAG: hypothetical protein IAE91_10275 [Ignavibacteriaceae bacterium]|nr:hypothetical protein [Ignavibacteriaceae bacterium]
MKKINNKTIKSLTLGTLLALSFFPLITSAQDLTTQSQEAEIQDVDGLRAEFKEYTQSPSTKKIKFEMILKSNIDSDRVRITWTTAGANVFEEQKGYTIEGTTARGNIAIRKGETYSIPIEVTVTGSAVNELFGKAEAFLAESTYIATVRKNYASNVEGEVLPITDAYSQSKTQNTILNIFVIIISVIIVLALLYLGLKLFLKWLDKDERDLNQSL